MDDSPENAENTNAQDNSETTTGNTAACPGTWLIVVVLLITAAAIAVAAFALYQWRRCAQADAQAAMSVAVSPTNEFEKGMRAIGVTPRYRSDLQKFEPRIQDEFA
jgi:hypothetical protein